jgi:hypothetical protein
MRDFEMLLQSSISPHLFPIFAFFPEFHFFLFSLFLLLTQAFLLVVSGPNDTHTYFQIGIAMRTDGKSIFLVLYLAG